jgi:hypothetical protein
MFLVFINYHIYEILIYDDNTLIKVNKNNTPYNLSYE